MTALTPRWRMPRRSELQPQVRWALPTPSTLAAMSKARPCVAGFVHVLLAVKEYKTSPALLAEGCIHRHAAKLLDP